MSETSVRPGWDTGDWSGLPPVTIQPYDPRWPALYEAARAQICQALAGLDVRVEHVGSTAVPALGARQGIDILIGLGAGLTEPAEPSGVEVCVARLQEIGFRYHFSKPGWTHLSGNGCKLHLTPLGSPFCGATPRRRRHTTGSSGSWRERTAPTANGTSTGRRHSCARCWSKPAARRLRSLRVLR
jgi:GrpB-like predicted nucleotidyltransferase (UPF0157 family)